MYPRIATPADTLTEATNIINGRNAAFASRPLVGTVIKPGGLPIVLPSVAAPLAPSYLDLFGGVIFARGSDVDPTFFNEEPYQKLGPTYLERDQLGISLATAAFNAGKPMMGTYRGMQVLNVTLGGTLYQDLSENPHQTLKHPQDTSGNFPSHHVNTDKAGRLFNLVGPRPYVNPCRHQSLNQIVESLRVAAWVNDRVPEVVKTTDSDQTLAV